MLASAEGVMKCPTSPIDALYMIEPVLGFRAKSVPFCPRYVPPMSTVHTAPSATIGAPAKKPVLFHTLQNEGEEPTSNWIAMIPFVRQGTYRNGESYATPPYAPPVNVDSDPCQQIGPE